jgi:hypothetical protein
VSKKEKRSILPGDVISGRKAMKNLEYGSVVLLDSTEAQWPVTTPLLRRETDWVGAGQFAAGSLNPDAKFKVLHVA